MRRLILMLLAGYKRWVSPQLAVACRFTPTCSDYAAEAVTRHGALGGTLLGLWRLLRCHPLGGRGLDPVPEHFCRRPAGAVQWSGEGYGTTDRPPAAGAPGSSLAAGTGRETVLRALDGPQALEPRH